jgi:hypothetical protein
VINLVEEKQGHHIDCVWEDTVDAIISLLKSMKEKPEEIDFKNATTRTEIARAVIDQIMFCIHMM